MPSTPEGEMPPLPGTHGEEMARHAQVLAEALACPDAGPAGDSRAPVYGEWLRGIWASEKNPQRDGRYVRTVRRTGRVNRGTYYELTNGRGSFWEYPASSTVYLRDNAREYAAASAAQAAGGGAVPHPFTFCWLVELRPAFDGHPHFPATYYTGLMMAGSFEAEKTTDPLRAARFTRKEDAERIAERLGHTLSCVWTAIEHGFAAPDHPSPSREGPSDAAQAKDAARYAWLRAGNYPLKFARSVLNDTPHGIDAAIDAAMKEHQP